MVAALRAENAELTAENADLRARITELAGGSRGWKRLISRNRGIRRCRRALMTCRAGRPPSAGRAAGVVAGKQPGAPGAYLAWREVPGKTEDLLPRTTDSAPDLCTRRSSVRRRHLGKQVISLA